MFGLLGQLVIFISFFAFCTYACIFADPDTSKVGRLFMITIPSALFKYLKRIIGEKRLAKLSKLLDHAFQLFYLIVVLGSWSIVFAYGYPEIEKSTYISSWHQYTGCGVFLLCMGSWHYACHVGPGNVTARSIPLFDHYEYDNILYTNKLCPTLKIRKIARSKYDRCSHKHVPRFDHFCGWLNQAVGERNYRWFLLFLTTQVSMCCYGTWAMTRIMYGIVIEKDLLNATFFNAITGAEVEADYIIVFHYLFARHFQICGVILLMSVMAIVLGIFWGFHIYITSCNMTTNEFFKRKSVKRWHKKETARYEQALKEGKIGTKKNSANKSGELSKQVPDGDVGCTGPTNSDPSPTVPVDEDIFDPGPMPSNIYNKGFISNWSEIFSPLSSRDAAVLRYRTALRASSSEGSNEKMLKSKAI